ncbi:group II intron maturase-specific domain-containing protein [Alicyclobacillus dauci]|uniref:Group II intron, maturase-specific domain n=1 Tax=Alicyclobacillus dauci TaxID=1475485 RepID=A0ABY6Z3W4_9BACL|nr:group II intron maturase-specific domain-containing protein [Alicyclobacillus dauci]WAH36974.1 hypothetical protein NZD86_22920 [Alicyclobacillus dauci]
MAKLRTNIRDIIGAEPNADGTAKRIRETLRGWWAYFRISSGGRNGPRVKRMMKAIRIDSSKQIAKLTRPSRRAQQKQKILQALHL